MQPNVRNNGPDTQPVGCDVVIPFHNQFDYVRAAVKSILKQEQVRCQIHLVDDASSEDPRPIFDEFAERPDVRCYQNPNNIGPYRSFHRAVPHCRSEFIAVQDADDLAVPQRIAVSVKSLSESGGDIFASAAAAFVGKPANVTQVLRSRLPRGRNNLALVNRTMVVRREVFIALNGFADFFCGADTEFVIRAYYSRAKFVVSKECLVFGRIHNGSLSLSPRTGFWGARNDSRHDPTCVSPFRARVWEEINRRFPIFCAGGFDPRHFGCLNPALSRTMGCVGDPPKAEDQPEACLTTVALPAQTEKFPAEPP